MMKYMYQYRINKRGAECYRSTDYRAVLDRYDTLHQRHPEIYTVQVRDIRLNQHGMPYDRDWSPWREWKV